MDWYDHGMPVGLSTGFANLDEYWRVLEGEMTIVTGVPSHGKSELVDSLLLNLYKLHGWRSTIFSPESYPEASHHAKILEKVVGKPFDVDAVRRWSALGFRSERMTRIEAIDGSRDIDKFLSFVSPGEESYSLDEILDRVRAEVFRRGIKVAVLDPWSEVDHTMDKGMSETQYISYALSKIRRFARHNGLHFFIVAHPTKLAPTTEKYEDDDGNTKIRSIYPPPTLYHISGSASWYNKADNGIIVWRDELADSHGANPHLNTIIVQKVKKKFVGRKGTVQLLWHPPSGRYRVPNESDLQGGGRPSSAIPTIEVPEAGVYEPDELDF
jgi:twinkle protein